MGLFRSQLGTQIIFVLGVINFLMALVLVVTCRCIPGNKILRRFTKNKPYQYINKTHCYLWWIFWPSVITHVVFTLARIGIPF